MTMFSVSRRFTPNCLHTQHNVKKKGYYSPTQSPGDIIYCHFLFLEFRYFAHFAQRNTPLYTHKIWYTVTLYIVNILFFLGCI